MSVFLLLSLFILSVISITPPLISNDFSSQSSIVIVTNEELDELNGLYAVDFTGRWQRISAYSRVNNSLDNLDVWKYWSSDYSGWEHENRTTGCTSRQLDGTPIQGLWDWLSHSSFTGNCTMAQTSGQIVGQKWSFSIADTLRYDACISVTGVPLWTHFISTVDNWMSAITVIFHTFDSGRPSQTLIEDIPQECMDNTENHKRAVEESQCNCGGKSQLCSKDGKFCIPCPCKKRAVEESQCNCGGKSQICNPDGTFCIPCPCKKRAVEESQCTCGGKSQICSKDGKFCIPCPC